MSTDQKQQLFQNYKAAMQGVPVEIVKRQIAHCYRADPEYGVGIAKAIGIDFKPQVVAAE
ncbi:catalase [Bradyrhizobium sp. F1.13.4]